MRGERPWKQDTVLGPAQLVCGSERWGVRWGGDKLGRMISFGSSHIQLSGSTSSTARTWGGTHENMSSHNVMQVYNQWGRQGGDKYTPNRFPLVVTESPFNTQANSV